MTPIALALARLVDAVADLLRGFDPPGCVILVVLGLLYSFIPFLGVAAIVDAAVTDCPEAP